MIGRQVPTLNDAQEEIRHACREVRAYEHVEIGLTVRGHGKRFGTLASTDLYALDLQRATDGLDRQRAVVWVLNVQAHFEALLVDLQSVLLAISGCFGRLLTATQGSEHLPIAKTIAGGPRRRMRGGAVGSPARRWDDGDAWPKGDCDAPARRTGEWPCACIRRS